MIRLDTTTKILQLIATATCDVTVTGSDKTATAYTGFSQETAATASTQTIGAAPAASTVRDIDHITIKSTGGANTLTVQVYNSSGAVTTQATYAVLAANETFEYTHASGFKTIDASGAAKVGTAGWVIAAGKIGTLSNSLTFAGTDGSTLNIGTGGTLGTAAYTAATAYEAAGAIATHAALQTGVHGLAITTAKTLTVLKSMSFTAVDDTGVYTLPTGTKTLLATDDAGSALTAVNAITLLTKTWAAPDAIGSGTPAAGSFTTLSASGVLLTTDATDASSATAASLKTAGGGAFAKGIWVGTTSRLVGAVTMDSTLTAAAINASAMLSVATTNFSGSNVRIGAANITGWDADFKILQFGGVPTPYLSVSQQQLGGAGGYLSWGAYGTGNDAWAYTTTGDAPVQFRLSGGGGFQFRYAASGTAGNAITWSEGLRISTTGAVTIPGTLGVTGAFGCNGTAAQTAYASGGALAAYGAGANGFDSGANASALHAMVVSIRAALVANGVMS